MIKYSMQIKVVVAQITRSGMKSEADMRACNNINVPPNIFTSIWSAPLHVTAIIPCIC